MGNQPEPIEPMPISSVLFALSLFAVAIFISALMLSQYKSVFFDRDEFVNYSYLVLIGIGMALLMLMVLYEMFLRNIKKVTELTAKHKLFAKYVVYLSAASLFIGPLIIRPVMNIYMKSQGYEYCQGTRSALDRAQSQNWAKPSVGCEVWELSDKERKALRNGYAG